MDRVGADFDSCVAQIRERLAANPIAIQLPVGVEDAFRGVVDLVEMKTILWRDEELGAHFDVDRHRRQAARATPRRRASEMIEQIAEVDDEVMAKFVERHEPSRRRAARRRCAAPPSPSRRCRSSAARPSRTRACSRCSTRSSTTCRRRPTSPPVQGVDPESEQPLDAPRRRRRAVRRARLQDHERRVRRSADLLPRLLGHARRRLDRLQRDQGQARAHRPPPAHARQQARGHQDHRGRQHRRRRRPARHHHRRHAVRREAARSCSSGCSSPSRSSRRRSSRSTKADQDKMGLALCRARRRGSDLPRPHRRRRPARPSSRAWASSTSRSSSTA